MHPSLPKHHGEIGTSQPINRLKRKAVKFNNRGSEIGLKREAQWLYSKKKHSGYIQGLKKSREEKRPKLYRHLDHVKISKNRLICKSAHNAAVRFTKQESKMAVDARNMKSALKRQEVKTELRFVCIHTL